MEQGEGAASKQYETLVDKYPEVQQFAVDESNHEHQLLNMLDEEALNYAGAVVLGLNDALVELTGALAGFTLSLGDTRVISMAGLITGIAASFSMAASAYLSARTDNDSGAKKSALYTGLAYILTVIVLILPFLLLANPIVALVITMLVAILIIYVFNYYLSVAKDLPFKQRFWEMAAISMGVALLSFAIGYVVNITLGV
jgi:VIT1/CCC1 family predicted Fe2+/Mn2+ transporter